MRMLIALALLAISGACLAEDWELKKTTDAMTDEESRKVIVSAPGGETFTLMRRNDGSVWGYVQLSGANQFGINDSLMIRVDRNKPQSFDGSLDKLLRKTGTPTWEWNPSLIGFRIWHGKPEQGCGMIGHFYHGQQIVIRYHPNQSTYRDITFTLTGNRTAISEALGFDASMCPAG